MLWPKQPPGHTRDFSPRVRPPWFPASDIPSPTAQPPPGPRPSAPGERLSAAGPQGEEGSIPSPGLGRGGQDPKLSLTSGSSLLSNNLLSPPSRPGRCWPLYLRHPPLPLTAGSHRPFRSQVGIAFSRQPSLSTARQGQMLLFTLSALCTPCPSMLPLPLGEGRACWIFCLPPQAMKSTGPDEDLACPSQLLTQRLPESPLPG